MKKARGEKLGEKVEASWKLEKKAGSWKRGAKRENCTKGPP